MHFPSATYFRTTLLALAAWAVVSPVDAATTALSYTLALPCEANLATPEWLGHPVAGKGTFASLDLPLISPETGASLLVTITFHETPGGFLRLSWKGTQGEQILSTNFYEGVEMDNQRTLLIPAAVVQGTGTLSLQTGDEVLNVPKISFEWLEERPALVSSSQIEKQVVSSLGKAAPVSAFDGSPPAAGSATLDGLIVSVPVTSAPQRIEQGVEFSLRMDGTPRAGRLSLEVSGLPWGRHLVLWINDQRAGTITPDVPDLEDTGFGSVPEQNFVGWRHASIFLPVALLRTGLNTLQFEVENDVDPTIDDAVSDQPLAVKQLVCQFDYATPAAGDTAMVSAATASAATPVPDDKAATPGASATVPVDSTASTTHHAMTACPSSFVRGMRRRSSRRGFTLIEMIIVLTIIGLLVGMAIYKLSGVTDSAKVQKVQADLLTFKEMMAEYELDNGVLPTTEQGIKIFWQRPATDPPAHWRALLDSETLDPWQHPYQYLNPGKHNPEKYDVWSMGPDGKSDTDDDIGNWAAPAGTGS